MPCQLDAFLRADDEDDVGLVVETRDRYLGGGRQLQVGQLLPLHSQDETVVFLGDLDPTTRLGNRGLTCKEMGYMFITSLPG